MHTNKPLTTGCCPDGTGYIKLHIGVKTEETEQHSENRGNRTTAVIYVVLSRVNLPAVLSNLSP